MTEEDFEELHDYRESDHFSEEEQAVLEYVSRLSASPAEVPDELFDELRNDFNEEQLVEMTALAAWENYRSRFNRGVDLQPQNFSDGATCTIPTDSP